MPTAESSTTRSRSQAGANRSRRSRWAIRIASLFVADDGVFKLQDRDFAALGREFEHHPFFPRRVNTEFILATSRHNLKMRVWERGSGETWACGTGACAALVAAVLTNHSERTATVELRGGNLEIEWRADGADANHVFMTGNAVEVFQRRGRAGRRRDGPGEMKKAGGFERCSMVH